MQPSLPHQLTMRLSQGSCGFIQAGMLGAILITQEGHLQYIGLSVYGAILNSARVHSQLCALAHIVLEMESRCPGVLGQMSVLKPPDLSPWLW